MQSTGPGGHTVTCVLGRVQVGEGECVKRGLFAFSQSRVFDAEGASIARSEISCGIAHLKNWLHLISNAVPSKQNILWARFDRPEGLAHKVGIGKGVQQWLDMNLLWGDEPTSKQCGTFGEPPKGRPVI